MKRQPAKYERPNKRRIELALSVVLPLLYLAVASADHFGVTDRLKGLDKVQGVGDNFGLSYGPSPSMPIYPDNPAWKPLLLLIRQYSKVKLRIDKQPQTIARFQASLSTEDRLGDGEISQWTSPSTPFVVLYRYWPANTGKVIPKDDYTVIGTIGDLQNWITQSKNDTHFLIQDVLLTLAACVLGYILWRINYVQPVSRKNGS
jgi:hypothetical protein